MTDPNMAPQPNMQQPNYAGAAGNRQVGKVLYVLMAWLFGYLGVHRFLRGQIGLGILMIITLGGAGIWYLIDLIIGLVKLGSYQGDNFEFTQNGAWA